MVENQVLGIMPMSVAEPMTVFSLLAVSSCNSYKRNLLTVHREWQAHQYDLPVQRLISVNNDVRATPLPKELEHCLSTGPNHGYDGSRGGGFDSKFSHMFLSNHS